MFIESTGTTTADRNSRDMLIGIGSASELARGEASGRDTVGGRADRSWKSPMGMPAVMCRSWVREGRAA